MIIRYIIQVSTFASRQIGAHEHGFEPLTFQAKLERSATLDYRPCYIHLVCNPHLVSQGFHRRWSIPEGTSH